MEKRLHDQLRLLQEITDQQAAKSQELAKVFAENDEALKALDADIQTRRPPPPEEETGQVSGEFPPLDEHDDTWKTWNRAPRDRKGKV